MGKYVLGVVGSILLLVISISPVLADPDRERVNAFFRDELAKNPNALANPGRLAEKFMRNILAENPIALELRNKRTYGRPVKSDTNYCEVITFVNLINDKQSQKLTCRSPEANISISTSLLDKDGFTLSLRAGKPRLLDYGLGEAVPMSLRFYPGPLIKHQGEAVATNAETKDQQFINSILVQLADEGRLVAVVGTKSGVIDDLTGASQAIQDFQQRVAAGPQTLDITPASDSE